MIIDAHGHYTTGPAKLQEYRESQLAGRGADFTGQPVSTPLISDDEIRESIELNQLRVLRERGTDLMLISPKASAMGHHVDDRSSAVAWARVNNDLIHRVASMFPSHFAAVCQLPQTPSGPVDDAISELRRCVDEMGFVGCNLNPDPSGGQWNGVPMTDEYWYPLYEAMVELDVPAMIHVSASRNPNFHTLGAHYLNADTAVFMQLVEGDLFGRFPGLRFVLPHGGGAVPYHWGRFRGLSDRLRRPDLSHVLPNLYFDTCVYHPAGIELLLNTVDNEHVLFASEMLGAVPDGRNPDTGAFWDDTKRYVDELELSPTTSGRIFELNARAAYPRLDVLLRSQGR
jgi:4-oxalmesaconate hydratase